MSKTNDELKHYEQSKSKARIVRVMVEFSTYGNKDQAMETARRATKELAVSLSKSVTGHYDGSTFIYGPSGNEFG